MIELMKISEEYIKKHPDGVYLADMAQVYSVNKLKEIYKESNGREIVFKKLDGHDNYSYSFN